MPRNKKFYVSGIIQFTVYAQNADEANQKALDRAQSLMKAYQTVNIDTDPDTAEEA